MTRAEARLAVRLNAIVEDQKGVKGYACALIWTHTKTEDIESISYHDMKANAIYQTQIRELKIADWLTAPNIVNAMLVGINQKLK